MKFDFNKKTDHKLAMVSIIALSSLSLSYHDQAIAGRASGGDHGGGVGNSEGRGNSQGAGNLLGDRADLVKAMNASDTARMHAADESAVILAIPTDP